MRKQILLSLGMVLLVFLAAQAASAITIKLSDRKVIANDNRDDSHAIQMAFNELLAAGGGTIEFPSGVVDVQNGINILPKEYKPVNVILKGDGGSIIRVSVGAKQIAFYSGNLNQLTFENLVFVGKNVAVEEDSFIDARYVIFAGWVSMVSITNTSFFGLAVPNGGAIVSVSSNLKIDNCQFDGNNAAYPNGAVVSLDCCSLSGQNANISNTTFLDYTHFNGQYLSKTFAFTGSWVSVKQVNWAGNPSNQRLTIDDSFFDEGAAWAINAENIAAVNVRGTRFNINGSDAGAGVRAINVKRLRIEDSHFGWSSRARPLAVLNKSTGEMIGVTRSAKVICPKIDEESNISWRLSDCE